MILENHEYGTIVGSSDAPYLNGLFAKYGLATAMDAVAHPSEPNYIALVSGGTQGVRDDGVFRRPPAVDSLAANPCSFGNRADGESADASCAQEVKGDVEDRVSGGLVAVTARVRPTRTRPGLISGAVSSRPMCGAPCRSSCAHIRDPSI